MSSDDSESLPVDPDLTRSSHAARAPLSHAGASEASEIDLLNAALRPAGGGAARYVAKAKLGEGGMGAVFMAEQRAAREGELRRTVALKVIPLGMNSQQIVARFEAERQTLALMQHPGIATVFDAGLLADGRPYFVMEHVPGLPITEFADANRLNLEQRLRLFQQVCDAVQHAHAKGIIHRDLKPTNVLAYMDANQPRAKVIDFGLAKAIGGAAGDATLHTRAEQVLGTYAFMSPEQAAGEADVDVQADVYSLGVLLYELLAGANPFDFKKLAEDEVRRVIRETDPPRPDSRLSSMGEVRASQISAGRSVRTPELRQRLAGELGWIPLKALKKRREERYETVPELRADIERYLTARPLVAGPDSAGYRFRKYLRRNRGLVAAVMTVLIVLIAGVIGSATGWSRAAATARDERSARAEADRQRAEADKQKGEAINERDTAKAVLEFLRTDLLAGARPDRIGDAKLSDAIVRSMIQPAAESVGKRFKEKPLVEAGIRNSLAVTFDAIGRADLALPHIEASLATFQKLLGADHPDTINSLNNYGRLMQARGKAGEAEPILKDALERTTRVLGAEHPETVTSLYNYAEAIEAQGRHKEAEPLFKEAYERGLRLLGPDHLYTLVAQRSYAFDLFLLGRVKEAEPLFKEALARSAKALGPDHSVTLGALGGYALTLRGLGHAAEAEPLFKDALERTTRVLGADHPNTLNALNNYAIILDTLNRPREAEPLYKDALARNIRVRGADHPKTITLQHHYAHMLLKLGRAGEAEPMLKEAMERAIRTAGPDDPDTLISQSSYAIALESLGRAREAEPLHKDTLARYVQTLGTTNPATIQASNNYAFVLVALKRLGEAEPIAKQTLEWAAASPAMGLQHRSTKVFARNYAKLLDDLSKPNEAKAVRAKYGLGN